MNKSATLVAVALLALLVAGCGGTDEPDDARAEFIASAGAICERSKERADRAVAREFPELGVTPPTGEQGRRILAIALRHIRAAGEEIAALDPPEADASTIAAYLASYREATAELEAIAANPRRTAALMAGSIEDPFVEADGMLADYGVEKCSGDDA